MANLVDNKSTINKPLGLLADGVELYSPSLFNESIYFGEIDSVQILNAGNDYDVINPPRITISDVNGYGQNAKVTANMKGELKEVVILSPGIGYKYRPSLSIKGGNIKGSISLNTNLVKKVITSVFAVNDTGVGSTTINFIGDHNFQNGEEVIYITNGTPPVVGLTTNSSYFVGIVDNNSISLYTNQDDAKNQLNYLTNLTTIVGINTGNQFFKTRNYRNVIDRVYIDSQGAELYNKSIKIGSNLYPNTSNVNGISIDSNYIYAEGHNFNEKDLVIYETSSSNILGLSTTTQYFVTKIDDNRFKLSDAGNNNIPDDSNYKNKIYVNLNSIGSGTHTFKYPPIEIDVNIVAESSASVAPVLKPVVLGKIDSVFLENKGVGYGLSEAVNIKKYPNISIEGRNYFDSNIQNQASLKAIVVDGKITDVLVLNSGKDYQDNIDIVVGGDGLDAKLYPNVVNGKIVSVTILSPGIGYNQKSTNLFVQRRGINAKLLANIKKWTINQYVKNKSEIDSNLNNGFVIPSTNVRNSYQFINFYPSNTLRDTLNDKKSVIKTSPILGWAYDGNPIFGPYKVVNNSVVKIDSGYRLKQNLINLSTSNKRPASSNFAFGYFIEDYEYVNGISELDENNGMYVEDREEFPNGTYAYFMTVDNADSPVYPYVVGNEFKNNPNPLNYDFNYYQNIDFSLKNYTKNTSSLYFGLQNSGYEYLKTIEGKYKQEITVKNALGSKIDGFKVINPGKNYKVSDNLVFSIENTNDIKPEARITRVNGKSISSFNVGITTLSSIKFLNGTNHVIGVTTYPHGLSSDDYLYITNSTNPKVDGNRLINVNKLETLLYSNHDNLGITTYIKLNNIDGINIEDFLKIDNETVKVLDIYPASNALFVERLQNLQSHTSGVSTVKLMPTRFNFSAPEINEQLSLDNIRYFNPRASVGLGSIGNTVSSPVLNLSYYVPGQSIYIPNHNFLTNQPLVYNAGNSFNGLLVSDTINSTTFRLEDGQTVYSIKISDDLVGITTVAYGKTALTFRESSYSSDEFHSFKYEDSTIYGKGENYKINIGTDEQHLLLDGDLIRINGKENTWEFYVSKFDLNKEYKVNVINNNSFSINLDDKPDFIKYPEDNSLELIPLNYANLSYNTNSKTAKGGINKVTLYTTGTSYKTIPILTSIESQEGELGTIIPYSNKIGRIDTIERTKDGFDYPSDITLQPRLSKTTVCYLDNVNKIKQVNVIYGGVKYNTPPTLKVVGNNEIKLNCTLKNSTVNSVTVEQNSSNLSNALEIIPTNNSNGFDILNVYQISPSANRVVIDINQFPLIYRDYAEPIIDYPFKVGDSIFIENCRVEEDNVNTYNSSDNYYTFFNVVGINSSLGYVDYSISDVSLSNSTFGTYTFLKGYGTIVNKASMAKFEMVLEKDSYLPGESIKVLNSLGDIKFTGTVFTENGWDPRRNQLRITNSDGVLNIGDIILGSTSLLKGKVSYLNEFPIKAKYGSSRDKVNYKDTLFDLNNDLKKLQDSYYYQDFSYSIHSKVPYQVWKEPVKSIIHPSGFIEFSNLEILSSSTKNLKIKTTSNVLDFDIKIENEDSFFTRKNFTIAYENEKINEFTTERIYTGSGQDLWQIAGDGKQRVEGLELLPYVLSKTNSVKAIKKIDPYFTGSYETISLGDYSVTFNANSPYYLGINTSNLEVGDIVGYSTYHQYPYNTRILSIGINSIRTLNPHNNIVGIVTESLEIRRNLNYNNVVGLTSFVLVGEDDSPVYKIVGVATNINLSENSIDLAHNFQTGQIVHYENIGGSPIQITPTSNVLGGVTTSILPPTLYVRKVTNNKFKVSGLGTSNTLEFTSQGSGIHKFVFDSPNESTIISIDNIIQVPVRPRLIDIQLSQSIGIGTTVIYVNSGITSITSIDILKVEDEYLKVISVGINSTNSIEVERGFLGTFDSDHTGINTAFVYRGNYRIVEDVIHFASPPYGETGLPGLEVSSNFSGRVFSRTFRPSEPNDKNIILDDISDGFVGVSSFALYENRKNVVGLYTNTNSSVGINLNNNPFIFINNIPQVTNVNFEIFNQNQNKIKFLNGTPKTGRILNFDIQGGFGYLPLVAAAATVNVSVAGTISNVYLNGIGSGYRTPPVISIISSTGYGASISASIDTTGSVNGLTIVNPGIGYTTSEIPLIIIDKPLPYYNLDLEYSLNSSGIGSDAKVSLTVESDSTIQKVELISSGQNYKVGDKLNVVGIKTDVGIGSSLATLTLTVSEVISDDFSGIYPGQFIQFDDVSQQFNSLKTSFDITANIDGDKRIIAFKNKDPNIKIENNFFIFINDILQEPVVSYEYIGGRIVFSEPPIEGSTCNILFYSGSNDDIEIIVPRQTIKNGDVVKFEFNELNKLSSEQTDRVVKRLISVNSLDTFPYSGFGITSIIRPITWTKQKNDRIINGSLIPKARETQKSNIFPTANLIWNLSESDKVIYVDNAYPLFIELDNGIGGLTNEKRNLNIVKKYTPICAEVSINVSAASSIASVGVITGGLSYLNNPYISISTPKYKDPFYSLNNAANLNTNFDLNSIVVNSNRLVAVGSSNLLATSLNMKNWSVNTINLALNSNLKKIISIGTQSYVAVGSSGAIFKGTNNYLNWTSCVLKQYVLGPLGIILGITTSTYNQTFNDIVYNENIDRYVAVGDGGKIYTASGISTSVFLEVFSQTFDYKSISYNKNITVAVGYQGISTSYNGQDWSPTLNIPSYNYEYVYWDEDKFIVVSNSGLYTSNDGITFTPINGSPTNFKKIIRENNVYVAIDSNGLLYKSLDLYNWTKVNTLNSEVFKDSVSFELNGKSYQVSVGAAGTVMYSNVEYHKALLTANVVDSQINSFNVLDGGFGYVTSNPPVILIEPPTVENEIIYTVDAKGDYGTIVGIKTSNTGIGTNTPSISFELLTDYSDGGYDSLNYYGITYSQLEIGDYFIISNSNVSPIAGYALTGITTSLGGMANYPNSKVGTATSYLDGVYKVEFVESSSQPQGIVTVTCHVYPVNGGIGINTSGVTTNYYGNYSWSKFFNYQDRTIRSPLNFKVNTDNSLVGLSTSPEVIRIPSLVF